MSGESCKSAGEVNLDRLKDFSSSDNDMGPTEDDLFIIRILEGIISLERMGELVLRNEEPPSYIYMIPNNDKYISTLGPLEVSV